MKRLLLIALAFATVVAVSCKKDDHHKQKTSYLQILKQDVKECLRQYPEFKKPFTIDWPYGVFREADYTLNGNLSDLSAKELKPLQVVYGFAYNTGGTEAGQEILEATRDFSKATGLTYNRATMPGYPQDVDIIQNLDKIISLEHAIENAQKANIVLPKNNKITLRKPASPYFGDRTIYFFLPADSDKIVVYVVAATGEVITAQR